MKLDEPVYHPCLLSLGRERNFVHDLCLQTPQPYLPRQILIHLLNRLSNHVHAHKLEHTQLAHTLKLNL